jgi:hypothetical protein
MYLSLFLLRRAERHHMDNPSYRTERHHMENPNDHCMIAPKDITWEIQMIAQKAIT